MTEKKNFMNKRISVIIPNYNGSFTIGRCLEAAFSSEYDNFDVIFTDYCSTDNSAEIIKEFQFNSGQSCLSCNLNRSVVS